MQKFFAAHRHKFIKAFGIFKSFFIPFHKFYQTPLYYIFGFFLKTGVEGLHLGGGGNRIDHFINIDANPFCECDVIGGVEHIKLRSNSVKTIYSSHIFEHIPRKRIFKVLKEWLRVLKPGGTMYICVPDIEILFRIYLENLPAYQQGERNTVDLAAGIVYGGQSTPYDFHYFGYSYTTLKDLLEKIGFKNIETFDRESLEFAPFDDAARSARIKDTLISLNVRASK